MGTAVLHRLTLVLAAVAFVLATAVPSAVSARGMPMAKPCGDCPHKAPATGDLGKMACGALACAGVAVGLPARLAAYLPTFAPLAYALNPVPEASGAAPAPDPFPPRPTVLA